MKSLITLKKPERSQTIIQELLDITEINAEGQPSHKITFETDARFEILARNVIVQEIDIDVLRDLTWRAIGKLKQSTVSTPEHFIPILTGLINDYIALPQKEYKILFVLNAQVIDMQQILPLDLLDTHLELSDWGHIQTTFEYKDWVTQFDWRNIYKEEDLLSLDFVPLIATTWERGWREAFSKGNRVINLFRAVLNFGTDYGRRTMMGEPPLANFLPSPIFGVFTPDGKFEEGFYTRHKHKYKAISIPRNLNGLSRILTELHSPSSDDDTMSMMLNVLQKYGQAMDAVDWQEAYLPFWQVLESVTLQSENLKMKEVIARLKTIFKQNILFGDLLDSMRDIRNDLVHSGQFSESGLTEVNFLKVIAENVIMFLSSAITDLPSRQHLEWFYTYSARGDADLEKLRVESSDAEFKSFVEKLRKSRKPKPKVEK